MCISSIPNRILFENWKCIYKASHVSMQQQVCWQLDPFAKKCIHKFKSMISWCNSGYDTCMRVGLLQQLTLSSTFRDYWHYITLSYKWWRYESFCLPCLLQQSSAVRELTGVSWLPISSLGMRLAVSRSRWMQSESAEVAMRKTWGSILKDVFTLPLWVAPPGAWLPLKAIINTWLPKSKPTPA